MSQAPAAPHTLLLLPLWLAHSPEQSECSSRWNVQRGLRSPTPHAHPANEGLLAQHPCPRVSVVVAEGGLRVAVASASSSNPVRLCSQRKARQLHLSGVQSPGTELACTEQTQPQGLLASLVGLKKASTLVPRLILPIHRLFRPSPQTETQSLLRPK
jgi:hypothetical protein